MATPIREFGKQIEYSSQISLIKYDGSKQLLTVTFKSGSTYEYYEVPTQVAHAFLQADSVGSYFHRNIRNQPYKYQRVEIKDDDQNGETGSL